MKLHVSLSSWGVPLQSRQVRFPSTKPMCMSSSLCSSCTSRQMRVHALTCEGMR